LVFQTCKRFNDDDAVDKNERERMAYTMRSGYQAEAYDDEETVMLESVKYRMMQVPDAAFRRLDHPDFRTRMSIAHVEGESMAYMKCEGE